MQYNSHSTSQDMVSLANLFTKQNNTTFPLTEKTLFANMGNRIILTVIHDAYGGWKYDDRNNTDLPIATTDLTADQSNFALPVDTNQLNGVYVLTPNTTDNWTKLIPITLEEINRIEAEPNFNNTSSVPQYYRTLSNSIVIYPASDTTVEDGLMVEYSGDISTFATTDTTKTAGFDTIFHEAIPVYMGYQFAQINGIPQLKSLTEQWVDYLARIKKHYSCKFKDMFPTRIKINDTLSDYI